MLKNNVVDCFEEIVRDLPLEILSKENYYSMKEKIEHFYNLTASLYVIEMHLRDESFLFDFSFRVRCSDEANVLINSFRSEPFTRFISQSDTWKRIFNFVQLWANCEEPIYKRIRELWFEFDSVQLLNSIPEPCLYYETANLYDLDRSEFSANVNKDRKRECVSSLMLTLSSLIDTALLRKIRIELENTVNLIPANAYLACVGVMLPRNTDKVRLCISNISSDQIYDYLLTLGWAGDVMRLNSILQMADSISHGNYTLSLDVTPNGISNSVGIEAYPRNKELLTEFRTRLIENGLCTSSKSIGLLKLGDDHFKILGGRWGQTAILSDLLHYKISLLSGNMIDVKAYYRFAFVCIKDYVNRQKTWGM